jgi:hypothetical protein
MVAATCSLHRRKQPLLPLQKHVVVSCRSPAKQTGQQWHVRCLADMRQQPVILLECTCTRRSAVETSMPLLEPWGVSGTGGLFITLPLMHSNGKQAGYIDVHFFNSVKGTQPSPQANRAHKPWLWAWLPAKGASETSARLPASESAAGTPDPPPLYQPSYSTSMHPTCQQHVCMCSGCSGCCKCASNPQHSPDQNGTEGAGWGRRQRGAARATVLTHEWLETVYSVWYAAIHWTARGVRPEGRPNSCLSFLLHTYGKMTPGQKRGKKVTRAHPRPPPRPSLPPIP